ncbi:hypothetical protein BN1221_04590c [Brenneria goodwinii]|uniref:Uncharacterized protein n=1 Tax=Brenneria goodwinii TaxID=1109412 RepID=A0A0G4K1U5_9GAMM|nr:hypothetical protein BN1221_04590c [Brenneria goodwinii]
MYSCDLSTIFSLNYPLSTIKIKRTRPSFKFDDNIPTRQSVIPAQAGICF